MERHMRPEHHAQGGRGRVSRRVPGRLSVGLLVALAVVLVGCSAASGQAGGSDPVATPEVRVDDDFFEPTAVEVPVGTEVTWTWVGNNQHNVTGDGFASETQNSGTFSYTFERAGTYEYACTLHPGMTGAVVVTEAAGGGEQ